MVMHARKIQRISDGYFEKHHTHPYQNSKYPAGSRGEKGSTYSERYNHHQSPNGSNSTRTDSPDSRSSQSPHPNQKKEGERDYRREKITESTRSPKDRRMREHSEQRTNHDRANSEEKRESVGGVHRVGDWSEHMSSSGKKYYYNCKSEVSQWEKPREWLEWERRREHFVRSTDKHSSSSSSGSVARVCSLPSKIPRHGSSGSVDGRHSTVDGGPSGGNEGGREPRRKHSEDSVAQDMDISPSDSTPTSAEGLADTIPNHSNKTTLYKSHPSALNSSTPPAVNQAGRMLLSHLSKDRERTEGPLSEAIHTLQTALLLTRQNSNMDTPHVSPPTQVNPSPTEEDTRSASHHTTPSSSIPSIPTISSPLTSSLSVLRPSAPSLTPSLSQYTREDLTSHIGGWPSELIEKQCQRLGDEAHSLGSLHCTRVSADLKMARSLVRLADIQATLQEQRILFIRQQMRDLEDLKSQQTSFMFES